MSLLRTDRTPAPSELAGAADRQPLLERRRLVERAVPYLLVAGAIAFGLVELRSELTVVAYTNDSSVHAEMVRFAMAQLQAGHLPMRSWYPYLGLGSPDFLHYQSLGATLTAVGGLAVGPNHAFAWSLYLLLSTWPLSVYWSGRLLGLDRLASGCAAACSPFVVSILGIGYAEITYTFIGFGMWSQLLAMWTLPLAWGASWRSVHTDRLWRLAPVLVALTVALHFMTGYLALGVVALWPFLSFGSVRDLARRLLGAGRTLLLAGLLAAWVIVPLAALEPYASTNELLQNGPDVRSYGAPTVLRWLAGGQLLDAHRLPVVTALAGLGLLVALARLRRRPTYRAILAALALSLVLFFGQPTLGPLLRLLPGHADLFLRRFLMGVQLSAVLLAGTGAAELARLLRRGATDLLGRLGAQDLLRPALTAAVGLAALVALLMPAWRAVAANDASNTRYIEAQQRADATSGRDVDALVAVARHHGPGRIYAGLPSNWGLSFDVGAVPVFRYLASLDVDEVGFTLRTASLMTNPEAYFDEHVPGDFQLFGVRYLLMPAAMRPPVPARRIAVRGDAALWTLGDVGLVGVVDTVGPPVVATRHDLGSATARFLESPMPGAGRYPTVAFDGRPAALATLPAGDRPALPPGTVAGSRVRLADGTARAVVRLRRTAVVVLRASYDPGWQATVDGRRRPTEIVAPALVGVRVGPGNHVVAFRYVAFQGYPPLFELAGATLFGLAAAPLALRPLRRRRRHRRRPRHRRRHRHRVALSSARDLPTSPPVPSRAAGPSR